MAGKQRGALALVTDTDEATASDTDTATSEATPQGGILHNAHDVDALQRECQALCNDMARLGAVVDMPRVEASAGVYALLRLLVVKGVCTEAEAEGERFTAMRALLRQGLQQVEEQRLKEQGQGPKVEPVRQPGLMVARH